MKDQTTISKLFMVFQAEQIPDASFAEFHPSFLASKLLPQNLNPDKVQGPKSGDNNSSCRLFWFLTQQIIGLLLVQGFVASLYTLHGPFLRAQGINWQISTREKRISKGISCEKVGNEKFKGQKLESMRDHFKETYW